MKNLNNPSLPRINQPPCRTTRLSSNGGSLKHLVKHVVRSTRLQHSAALFTRIHAIRLHHLRANCTHKLISRTHAIERSSHTGSSQSREGNHLPPPRCRQRHRTNIGTAFIAGWLVQMCQHFSLLRAFNYSLIISQLS